MIQSRPLYRLSKRATGKTTTTTWCMSGRTGGWTASCRPMTSTAGSSSKPNALFLNAARLNYDNALDFTRWHSSTNLTLHLSDNVRDPAEVIRLVKDTQAEIIITKEMEVPASTFAKFPDTVKLLLEAGTGFNNLPIKDARARGIPVCNIPTYSTEAVAHMGITYLLNLSMSMFDQQRMLIQGDRRNFTGPFTLPLHEVTDKTLGLVGGAGRIGTKVAEIALVLGMKIIISSRKGTLDPSHVLYSNDRVECTSDVNYLLQNSDFVSLHTPLNDETRGSFGRKQFEQMKPTAFFINTSRGALCNEPELIEIMKEGRIAGAGLDVTTTEPPAPDSELWNLPNVWLSPHTGWRRLETRQRSVDMVADNIEAYCKAQSEKDLINVIN